MKENICKFIKDQYPKYKEYIQFNNKVNNLIKTEELNRFCSPNKACKWPTGI